MRKEISYFLLRVFKPDKKPFAQRTKSEGSFPFSERSITMVSFSSKPEAIALTNSGTSEDLLLHIDVRMCALRKP